MNKLTTVKIIENEVYSRVVGYYRPINNWNAGKKKEFETRYLIPKKGLKR